MKPIPKTPDGKTDWDAIQRERLAGRGLNSGPPSVVVLGGTQ